MDILSHNRAAWNKKVAEGDRWTQPVKADVISRARRGKFELLLTPTKPVPMAWFGKLKGTPTLCLASGGGQQGPLLAAAGADVTVLDNSPRQLAQDRLVAEQEGLSIRTVEGDMANLSVFDNGQFQLIVHPVSNCFASDVRPVWSECFRVLRPGGVLLAGFNNPLRNLFDEQQADQGNLVVRHTIPYSDLTHLNDEERERLIREKPRPLEFGHTLADQIGGQLDAGFLLSGFYEDGYGNAGEDAISKYIDSFIATRAFKP